MSSEMAFNPSSPSPNDVAKDGINARRRAMN
jgi:hypothetical protein